MLIGRLAIAGALLVAWALVLGGARAIGKRTGEGRARTHTRRHGRVREDEGRATPFGRRHDHARGHRARRPRAARLDWREEARKLGAEVVTLPDIETGAMSVAGKLTELDLARYSYVLGRVRGSLLDVGCGRGVFLDGYAGGPKAGVDIVKAIDPEWPLHIGDATDLPYPDAAWDTVSAQEMLEHQPDGKLEIALAELRRVARARLLVTVPFCERRLRSGHVQRFDAARLAGMFPSARFTILDKGTEAYPWVLIEEPMPARNGSASGESITAIT